MHYLDNKFIKKKMLQMKWEY